MVNRDRDRKLLDLAGFFDRVADALRDLEVIGFLYVGTRKGPSKNLPELDPSDFLTHF